MSGHGLEAETGVAPYSWCGRPLDDCRARLASIVKVLEIERVAHGKCMHVDGLYVPILATVAIGKCLAGDGRTVFGRSAVAQYDTRVAERVDTVCGGIIETGICRPPYVEARCLLAFYLCHIGHDKRAVLGDSHRLGRLIGRDEHAAVNLPQLRLVGAVVLTERNLSVGHPQRHS